MANEFIARNGLIAQNNSTITGSLTVTNGITGSLSGTASFSTNATSASFSITSSYNITSSLTPTSSYAITASLAQSVEFEGKPLSAGWPGNYLFPFKFTTPVVSLVAGSQLDNTSNIRYYPIQLSRDTLISSIGALVRSAGAATGSYRLGIYNSVKVSTPLVQGSTSLPGKLLGDYGLISQIGTASAFAQIAISDINRPTLKKGEIYWLAISPSGSTTQALTGTNNTLWNDYFGSTPSTTTIASYVGISVPANGGAALPNPANTASISLLGPSAVKPFPILKITGSIK
jgi:hypothetical protein